MRKGNGHRRFFGTTRRLGSKPAAMDVIRQAFDAILIQARALPNEDLKAFYSFREDYAHVVGWAIRYANMQPYILSDSLSGSRRQIFKLLIGQGSFEDQVNAELRKNQLPSIRYAADFFTSNKPRSRPQRKSARDYVVVLADLLRRLNKFKAAQLASLMQLEHGIQTSGVCSDSIKAECVLRARRIDCLDNLGSFLQVRLACEKRSPSPLVLFSRSSAPGINDAVALFIEQHMAELCEPPRAGAADIYGLLHEVVQDLGIDESNDTLFDHLYGGADEASSDASFRPVSIKCNRDHYEAWNYRLSNDLALRLKPAELHDYSETLLLALSKVDHSADARASVVESNLKTFLWKHRPKEGSVIHFEPRKKPAEQPMQSATL